ncbi:MAG: C40 family peptidase [Clostridia bacterium]|nr:C40 family peptidase [Clostridia bacterium]
MEEHHSRGSPRLQFSREEMENDALSRPIASAERAADRYDAAKKKLRKGYRIRLSRETEETKEPTAAASSDHLQEMPGTGRAQQKPGAATPRNMPGAAHVVPHRENASDIRTDPQAPAVQNTRQKPRTARAEADAPGSIRAPEAEGVLHDMAHETVSETVSPAASPGAKKKVLRLRFEETHAKKPSQLTHSVKKAVKTAGDQLRRQAKESNEDDNVTMEAALQAGEKAETALQMGEHAYHAHRMRPNRRLEKAEKRLDRANIHVLEKQAQIEHPQFTSNPYSRWQQKRAIRREYAAAKRGANGKTVHSAAKRAEKATEKVSDAAVKTVEGVRRHPTILLLLALGSMLLIVMSSLQACTPLAQSVLESIVIGTYPAEEADVRAAERVYAEKERQLQDEMDHYKRYHPGYDEYRVEADEIWHNPYVLIAIISAYYDGQDWDIDSAMPVIEKYFNLQYVVTETISTQTRYRTEDGESVPYTYTICSVKMENKDLSHLPVVSMSHHTMGMYALYMASHGNMEGIFHGPHAVPLKDPMLYDIPQETLDADPSFARLMEEATKYVGYPYVWGGASPETSFDCSGFVSYVFTASGVYNTGRLGAKGLRSLCRNVPTDQVKPGDIVFFEGTMGDGVAGITHCGIYVGNNMMIHCGSPLGYANLNDSYWRQHFHSFGRVPN